MRKFVSSIKITLSVIFPNIVSRLMFFFVLSQVKLLIWICIYLYVCLELDLAMKEELD